MFTVLLVLTVDSSLSWMLDVANAAKVSTFLSCFNFLTVFASFFSLLLMMAQSNTLIHPFSQMARGPAPSMPFVLIPLGAIELIVLVTALTSLSALHPGCSSAQPPRRPWQLEGSKVGNLKLQRKKTIQKKKKIQLIPHSIDSMTLDVDADAVEIRPGLTLRWNLKGHQGALTSAPFRRWSRNSFE